MKTIFERIINGEIPALKIYEDKKFVVILDAFPLQQGHTLVIPKIKKENFLLEDDNLQKEMIILGVKYAKQIQKNLQASGTKLIINNGASAGQRVFHTHLHIVPYYDGEQPVALNNEEILAKIIKGK